MKGVYIIRYCIFIALLAGVYLPGSSQDNLKPEEYDPEAGDDRSRLTSVYREFYKKNLYGLALEPWSILFHMYPEDSERIYVDGAKMYRYFIEEAPIGDARENKIDTLMLIYDRRMAHFGGEGNVLGRKGNDLLRYRSSDKEEIQAAYGMLKKSLEIEGSKSRESVMLNFFSAGLMLNQMAMMDNNHVLEDYFMISGLLDQQEGNSSRRERTRAAIDEMILKEDLLSCEDLDMYFGTRFEQNSMDMDLLEKMIHYYSKAGCNQSDLYAAAAEKLFENDPGSGSAHNLAHLFIGRNDLQKAAHYLQLAVVDKNLPDETRAQWFYELSNVSLAIGESCEAIRYAREAIAYKDDHGKAYMALGDAIIGSSKQLGDEFQHQSAYWAAADMYQTAARVDPALAEESSEKLAVCTAQFPDKEDVFFQDLKPGSNYLVEGCIQVNTTIRSRD